MRIGFLGGAFNPPTYAHLDIAKTSIERMNLDRFFFVPMGNTYKKKDMIDENVRLEMLRLLCNENLKIEVSNIEIVKKEKTNTSQAFKMIYKEFEGEKNQLFFVMGADNFLKLPYWEDAENLISNYKYIIINRGDFSLEDTIKNNKALLDNMQNFNIINIDEKYKYTSSTEVRRILSSDSDEKLENYIPKNIIEYIKENEIWK